MQQQQNDQMVGGQNTQLEENVTAGPYKMRTTWFGQNQTSSIDLMAMHGIGPTANRLGASYLLNGLAKRSISSASFDFPGHGDSPGEAERATLNERVQQARAMVERLKPTALLGVSMGGFAAVRIAAALQPKALILLCPALYPASSTGRMLDSRFVSDLGNGEWFQTSPLLSDINSFSGDLLILGGTEDRVTPPDSFQMLYDAATAARRREIVWLEGCSHAVHNYLRARLKLQDSLIEWITASIRTSGSHNIQDEIRS